MSGAEGSYVSFAGMQRQARLILDLGGQNTLAEANGQGHIFPGALRQTPSPDADGRLKMAQCPKCGSKNTYEIGNGYGCRMCGKQFSREGVNPIIVNKVAYERKKDMPEEIKKCSSGKKGVCINCRREVWIADKFGRCTVCSSAVKGLSMDTTEYIDALIAVKARLTDPKNTHARATKKAKAEIKAALDILPRPRFKSALDAPVRAHRKRSGSVPNKPTPPPPATRKSALDMTIMEVSRTSMPRIICIINAEINAHMADVDKLQKARAILERV